MTINLHFIRPQAADDVFAYSEAELGSVQSGTAILLDVMGNDRGGNGKRLYSIDDGECWIPIELLWADPQVNGVSSWEATASGNRARINNGKVEIDLGNALAAIGATSIDALGASDSIEDSFVYAIRLGNGTLSFAEVTLSIQGENDAATISGDAAGTLGEDDTDPLTGTVIVSDVDRGEAHALAVTDGATANGYGTYSIDADGNWSYTVDNAAVQHLDDGESLTDSFVVKSLDGTAEITVTVTIAGADDAPPELSFSRTDYFVGNGPQWFDFGDFNEDGHLDLATGLYYDSAAAVLLGDGTGAFSAPTSYEIGPIPHAVVAADVNGDGHQDIVAETGFGFDVGSVSVLLGDGTGNFEVQPETYPVLGNAIYLDMADFDGDGNLDAIVPDQYLGTGMSLLFGNGDGTFQEAVGLAAGEYINFVTIADFDEDGSMDLVAQDVLTGAGLLLLNNGDGTFLAPISIAHAGKHADLNGDGHEDLVGNQTVMLGNGDGTFQAPFATPGVGAGAFADLNDDGILDVACGAGPNSIAIELGNGDGTFHSRQEFAVGFSPWHIDIRDLNGDGRADMTVSNTEGSSVSVLLNTSDFVV